MAELTGRRPAIAGVLTRSRGDFEEILERSELIVELMGGIEPARDYVLRSLGAGRSVVTANKQLLSQHGEELFEVARANDVQLRFEASVAGVVPVVRVLSESLAAAHVERIHGIVNGTTNFILSEMAHGLSYAEALAEAQRLGYAEADPSDDVDGKDAAAKMAILARLAFGTPVHLDQVPYEGITDLQSDDMAYARELGLGLKLIGTAERRDGGLSVRVHPAFLYAGHPLASVSGPFNAVTVEAPAITEITMSGPGAGGPQTASAVLGDVISVMFPPATPPPPQQRAADHHRRRLGVLPAHGGRRPPGRARPDRRRARGAGRLDQVGRAARPRRARATDDGHPPAAGVAPVRGAAAHLDARAAALAPPRDPRHRRGVRVIGERGGRCPA